MYADAIMSSVIDQYNHEISKTDQEVLLFKDLLDRLAKAHSLISSTEETFYSRGFKQECTQLMDVISAKIERLDH